jgi:hypothetical protein
LFCNSFFTVFGIGTVVIKNLAENEDIQNTLIGLAPHERAARMQTITQTAAMGIQMGMTKEASMALTAAILAQRKASSADRFKAAGMARMAGSMTGMSASDAEELARFSQIKDTTKMTPQDLKRFQELAAQQESRLSAMESSGNVSQINIAEQIRANMTSAQTDVMSKAAKGELTKQSGPIINKDFGAATGEFAQGVAEFGTFVTGLTKNPLIGGLLSIIAPVVGAMASMAVAAKLMKSTLGGGLVDGLTDAVKTGTVDAAKKGGKGGHADLLKAVAGASNCCDDSSVSMSGTDTSKKGKRGSKAPKVKSPKAAMPAVAAVAAAAPDIPKGKVGVLKSIGEGIKNLFPTFAKMPSMLAGAKAGIAAGAAGLMTAVGSAASGIFSVAKVVLGPISSFLFGAVEEVFTGNMANALGMGDGMMGRLMGVVLAGVNSIFTGVTRLFDAGVNGLFEGLGISYKVNTTKLVDYVFSLITDFTKMIGAGLMKGLALIIEGVMGIFGVKAPFVEKLRASAGALDQSIMESTANREKMWATEGATLRSVGEDNIKAAKDAKKEIVEITKSTQNNVVMGAENLMSAVKTTVMAESAAIQQAKAEAAAAADAASAAKIAQPAIATPRPTTVMAESAAIQQAKAKAEAAAASAAQPAQPAIATPGPTTTAKVTEPEVNRMSETKEAKVETKEQTKISSAAITQTDALAILQQQLDVAKQMLEVLYTQAGISEDTLKKIGRRGFSDQKALFAAATGMSDIAAA